MDEGIIRLEGRLHNLLCRQLVKDCGKPNVTKLQGMIMHYIVKHSVEPVYQKDLENFFNIRRATVTVVLNQMQNNGLIVRENSQRDKRMKKILLTEKGMELTECAINSIYSIERKMIENIKREDLEIFEKVINKMCLNLEEKHG